MSHSRGPVREGDLPPESTNKTLTLPAAVLDQAVEYQFIDGDPAVGKRRRLRGLELGGAPLPTGLMPHSLRRTFASVLCAIGPAPPVVMAEMGHTDAKLALSIYAQATSRDEGQIEALRELVEGVAWAPAGHPGHSEAPSPTPAQPIES